MSYEKRLSIGLVPPFPPFPGTEETWSVPEVSPQNPPSLGSHAPAWEQACPDAGWILTLQRHENLGRWNGHTYVPTLERGNEPNNLLV